MTEECYKCGTILTSDPIGYSPPCWWCPKCGKIRDQNYDEEERMRQQAKKEVFDDFKNILRDNRHSTILKELSEVYDELKKRHLSPSNEGADNSDFKICSPINKKS